MGIEDDFYATIKFKSGEEIFSKVAASEEEDRTMLILSHPINIIEVKGRKGDPLGYKIEPWLKTTTDDMFIINMDDVLTLSESSDIEMIMMYQNYVRSSENVDDETNRYKLSHREMGYISSVADAKEVLEKIFKLETKDTQ
jgi:hypothetical protein|tara:strand:+ start:201 stop:623 length:423 start_codon:yes stop_codon:yes gene_type:complete